MKIVVSPVNYNDAIHLSNMNADIILVGENRFCIHNTFDCNIDCIKKIIKNKYSNTEVWVNISSFIYEDKIEELQKYLIELSKLNIDRIVFNDFAIPQINKELNLNLKLHYDPSTLMTSYGQFDFYINNKFSSISLANELFLPEVKDILLNKPKNIEVLMQVQGFVLVMYSRWNLITNFKNYIDDTKNEYTKQKIIQIREETRKYNNNIIQDNHGTYMFTGYELCLIKYLRTLYDLNLDYIKIDNTLQINNDYNSIFLKIYQNAIKFIENNDFDNNIDDLYNQCLLNVKDKDKMASGFIGGIKEILHYENK